MCEVRRLCQSARWALAAAASLSCAQEPAKDPTVRFAARPTGVEWTKAPVAPAERAAEAAKLSAEGSRLVDSGDLLGGVARLRRAVDLSPADLALRTQLGQGFERLGDPDAALTLLRETLKTRPQEPGALFALGRLMRATENRRSLEEIEEGLAAWKQLAAVTPGGVDAATVARDLPSLEKRRAALAAKQAPAAGKAAAAMVGGQGAAAATTRVESTETAAPSAPSLGGAAGALAAEEPTSRKTVKTVETPKTLSAPRAAAATGDADDALMAGNTFLERGQFNEAAAAYERALRGRPEDREARWLLGLAHERAGRGRDAVKAWAPLAAANALEGRRRAQYDAARKGATP